MKRSTGSQGNWTRAAMSLLLVVLATSAVTADTGAGANQIRAVKIHQEGGQTVVTVVGSAKPTFTAFKLSSPQRLVVDLANSRVKGVPSVQAAGTPLVDAVAVSEFSSGGLPISRVMVGFKSEAAYRVKISGNNLVISLRGGPQADEPVIAGADPAALDAARAEADAAKREWGAAKAEADDAKRRVAAMQAEAEAARSQLDAAKAELGLLKAKGEAEAGSAKQATLEAKAAQTQLDAAKAELARLKATGTSALEKAERRAEQQIAALRSDIAEAEAKIAKDRKVRESLESHIASLEDQKDKARIAAERAEQARAVATKAQTEAKADLSAHEAAARAAKAEAAAAVAAQRETQIAFQRAAATERAELEAQLARRERETVEAKRRVADLEAAKSKLDKVLSSAQGTSRTAEVEAARALAEQRRAEQRLTEEVARADARRAKAEKDASIAAAKAAAAIAQKETAEREMQAARERAIFEAEGARVAAFQAVADAEARVRRAEAARGAAEANGAEISKRLAAAEQTLAKSKTKAAAAEIALEGSKATIAEQEKKIAALVEASRSLEAQAATKEEVARKTIATQEKRIAELEGTASALTRQSASAEAKARAAEQAAKAAEQAARAAEQAAKIAAASAEAKARAAEQAARVATAAATSRVRAAEDAAKAAKTTASARAKAAEEVARKMAANAEAKAAAAKEAARIAAANAEARAEAAEQAARIAAANAEARAEAAEQAARIAAANVKAKAEAEAAEKAARIAVASAEARAEAAEEAARIAAADAEARAAKAADDAAKLATAKIEEPVPGKKGRLTQEEQRLARLAEMHGKKAQPQKQTHAADDTLPPEITDIRFVDEDGVQKVVIETNGEVAYDKSVDAGRKSSLVLRNAALPAILERTLDAGDFGGSVRTVSSYEENGAVRIDVELDGAARSSVTRTGNAIEWAFAKPARASGSAAPTPLSNTTRTVSREDAATYAYPLERTAAYGVTLPNKAADKKKRFTGRHIDLDFKDADIHNILRLLSDVGQVNIVTADDVGGSVTIRMRDVPWDQALDVILQAKHLGMVRDGNLIRVAPLATLEKEREMEIARRRQNKELEPIETRLIPISYASAEEIMPRATDMLSERGRMSVDARTNVIIARDTAGSLDQIEALVRNLDTQTPQVLIEGRIVEASSTYAREIGIQWGGDFAASSATGNPTGLAFPSTVGVAGGATDNQAPTMGLSPVSGARPNPNFAVNLPAAAGTGSGGAIGVTLGSIANNANLNLRLSAMEEEGTLRILSSPKILTLDNRQAHIEQGTLIPYSRVSAQGIQTAFKEAKLNLTVTPHVTADGSVLLKLMMTRDEPDFNNKGARGDPTILKREAETELLVSDGHTAVIGGIFTRNSGTSYKKVPFFGDIPILGWLFKNRSDSDRRSEMLIFITPRIVNRAESIGN